MTTFRDTYEIRTEIQQSQADLDAFVANLRQIESSFDRIQALQKGASSDNGLIATRAGLELLKEEARVRKELQESFEQGRSSFEGVINVQSVQQAEADLARLNTQFQKLFESPDDGGREIAAQRLLGQISVLEEELGKARGAEERLSEARKLGVTSLQQEEKQTGLTTKAFENIFIQKRAVASATIKLTGEIFNAIGIEKEYADAINSTVRNFVLGGPVLAAFTAATEILGLAVRSATEDLKQFREFGSSQIKVVDVDQGTADIKIIETQLQNLRDTQAQIRRDNTTFQRGVPVFAPTVEARETLREYRTEIAELEGSLKSAEDQTEKLRGEQSALDNLVSAGVKSLNTGNLELDRRNGLYDKLVEGEKKAAKAAKKTETAWRKEQNRLRRLRPIVSSTGKAYIQLYNILKDIGTDETLGRLTFKANEIVGAGVDTDLIDEVANAGLDLDIDIETATTEAIRKYREAQLEIQQKIEADDLVYEISADGEIVTRRVTLDEETFNEALKDALGKDLPLDGQVLIPIEPEFPLDSFLESGEALELANSELVTRLREDWQDFLDNPDLIFGSVSALVDGISAVAESASQARVASINNEIRAAKEAGRSQNELRGLYRKLEKERERQWRIQKRASIGQAIINTAEGVTEALSEGNFILAGLIGVAGALQVAAIQRTRFDAGGGSVRIPDQDQNGDTNFDGFDRSVGAPPVPGFRESGASEEIRLLRTELSNLSLRFSIDTEELVGAVEGTRSRIESNGVI